VGSNKMNEEIKGEKPVDIKKDLNNKVGTGKT
jgi:hypothetical protein